MPHKQNMDHNHSHVTFKLQTSLKGSTRMGLFKSIDNVLSQNLKPLQCLPIYAPFIPKWWCFSLMQGHKSEATAILTKHNAFLSLCIYSMWSIVRAGVQGNGGSGRRGAQSWDKSTLTDDILNTQYGKDFPVQMWDPALVPSLVSWGRFH